LIVPFDFDFKKPDYTSVWEWRVKLITLIRETQTIDAFRDYYRDSPNGVAAFISHWGCTWDPRNADIGLPTTIPFVLFDKQEEWIAYVLRKWRTRENGLTEKSRDGGLSWLAVALSCTLCLFNEGVSVGFGSRKEEYVDKLGDPKSLFWKARFFMKKLPVDFRGNWNLDLAPHMRILFPNTDSSITGESGDNIGRGDRKSIYFVDEAAHIERPQLVDASLSATTNCRQDISSVAGMDNPFAQKRFGGKIETFTFHWRDDPRKDDAWYEKQKNDLDPVTLAQEIDINYNASVEGIVIPHEWAQAAVDAHKKLAFEVTGGVDASLDVADEGIDLNAFGVKHGIQLIALEEWSGKGSDTLYTCERTFALSDEYSCSAFQYDADGIGSSIRGDARMINERRKNNQQREISVVAFRGSGEVLQPDHQMVKGRKNKDFFKNRKSQAWWSLRIRFQNTHRAINGGEYDKDQLISISSELKLFSKLMVELSQPTYELDTLGKVLINKKPDGTRSPNLADVIMMLYSPRRFGLFS
jgi:phage terminase large subunit